MRLRFHGLAAVGLAAAALGCGGEDPPPDEPIDAVTRYLPAGDSGLVTFADLTAAREQLGLPAHADALPFGLLADGEDYDPESPKARLLEAAGFGMPSFGFVIQGKTYTVGAGRDLDVRASDFPKPELDPVTEAFDGRAIAAAATGSATGGPRGPLTAIRTSQPFDELADSLAKQGYEREGDVLSKSGAPINEVADAGDGVVVLSAKQASAAAAVANPGGGPSAALALLEPADEPLGEAIGGFTDDCVTAYGGWQDARGSSGTFVVATDGAAALDQVELDGFQRFTGTDLGEPSAEDNSVEVPFSGGGEKGASPVRGLMVSLGRGLYDCD